MKDVLDVHRALLARGVPHEVVRLPRAIATAEDIPDATGLPRERCAVVRHYVTGDRLVAVVVPAGAHVRPAAVLAAVGTRSLAPAPAELVNRVTDYAVALAAPLLLPDDVIVLMEVGLLRQDVLYVPTGDSGTIIGIPSATLAAESEARLVPLCTGPAIDLRTPVGLAVPAASDLGTVDDDTVYPSELTAAGRSPRLRR